VSALTDCHLLEITADDVGRLVLTDPSIVHNLATAVATRQAELDRHRAASAGLESSPEPTQSFLARVWRFFHLSPRTGQS
jgi:CRP-like cAMP-binding protein